MGNATTKPKADPAQTEEEEATNVYSLKLDTLQCDICFTPFESQVYSCKNGHAACGNCYVRLDGKCPSCKASMGDFRCRAMEKILASMTRPCKFTKHGCDHILRFPEIQAHEEETCPHRPHESYHCPFDGCAYLGSHLRDHMLLQTNHGPLSFMDLFGRVTVTTLNKSTPFRVVLHLLEGESVFLLLNHGDVPSAGRSLSVVRIYPRPAPAADEDDGSGEAAQRYTMVVKGGHPGALSLTASGNVPFVRRLEGYKPREYLFVPDACWGSSQTVTVTLDLSSDADGLFFRGS